MSNHFSSTDQAILNDVNEMLLDLPVAAENKLRAKMLVAIFSNYGKHLLNKGKSFKDVSIELTTILKQFKDSNGTFCNADYTTKTLENVGQYAAYMKQNKREIAQNFLADSATYLTKYISDADIERDCEKAHESLFVENNPGLYSFAIAMNYMDQCKVLIKKYCDIDVDYINSLF